MHEYSENKGQFIDDLLRLVDKSISYRFLEQLRFGKSKSFQRKKAALIKFRERLVALKAQEDMRNRLTEEELKNMAKTFFILLLQKNFFTLTYENWAADFILKELNTNGAFENLRNFLFPRPPQLAHSEPQASLLPAGNVKYSDVGQFVCNGQNNKSHFSIWHRQTTFRAFWNNDAAAKEDHKRAVTGTGLQFFQNAQPSYIVPHAERLLFAAKILAFAALLALATTATFCSLGIGSPLLVLTMGICVSALFTSAWIITKKVGKDEIYANMHPSEETYHKSLVRAAA